ncbi:MAG: hypothetical protein J6H18_01040, partial [Lachnospiraceae bacterium]|nr:hypothetical protein [Lachnospiraceae bacterium]
MTWILLLLSAAFAAVGFYKFSYFTTVGHALVTGGLGLCCLIVSLSRGKSSAVLWISVLLCLIYGLFQGGLAALSELLKTSRKKVLKSEAEENTPLYVSICFWLAATLAGFCQISPLWYRVSAGLGKDSILSWLGLFLMLGGVAVILLALRQAHGQRQKDPSLPPMEGLYNWVRCPGQLGRLLF